MTIRCIDTSHHQNLTLSQMRTLKAQHGLSVWMAKCTEGMTFTDADFAASRIMAKSLGYAFGAYHYAHPASSGPITQARRFFSVFKPKPGDHWCLDLEVSDGFSQPELNTWAMGFGDEMRKLWPGAAIAYLGGYSQNNSGRNASQHFDYWMYPRYKSMTWTPGTPWPAAVTPQIDANTTGWARPHIWQWTPVLPPGVDASVSSLTVADFAAPSALGGDLELTTSQFDQLMAAVAGVPDKVWAEPFASKIPEQNGQLIPASNYIPAIHAHTYPPAPTADQIADAVVAKLPDNPGGGATPDEVKQAVKDALLEGVSPPPATP